MSRPSPPVDATCSLGLGVGVGLGSGSGLGSGLGLGSPPDDATCSAPRQTVLTTLTTTLHTDYTYSTYHTYHTDCTDDYTYQRARLPIRTSLLCTFLQVLVVELWEGLPRTCPQRCTDPWGACYCRFESPNQVPRHRPLTLTLTPHPDPNPNQVAIALELEPPWLHGMLVLAPPRHFRA